jgi:hypothetical protein
MKIKRDEAIIELPEQIDASAHPILAIFTDGDPEFNPGSYGILVPQVERHMIFDMTPHEQERLGRPTMYSILHHIKPKLALWPRPDREYYATFEFSPPRKRL